MGIYNSPKLPIFFPHAIFATSQVTTSRPFSFFIQSMQDILYMKVNCFHFYEHTGKRNYATSLPIFVVVSYSTCTLETALIRPYLCIIKTRHGSANRNTWKHIIFQVNISDLQKIASTKYLQVLLACYTEIIHYFLTPKFHASWNSSKQGFIINKSIDKRVLVGQRGIGIWIKEAVSILFRFFPKHSEILISEESS